MSPSPQSVAGTSSNSKLLVLVVGDLLMLLIFVVIGRISHGMTSDWLVNVLRIATPFVVGWAIAALITGAYRPHPISTIRWGILRNSGLHRRFVNLSGLFVYPAIFNC